VNRDSKWFSFNAATKRVTLTLQVHPNARKNEIVGLHGGALKIKVAARAVDNRANAALIEFLSEAFDIPKSTFTIRHGMTGRRKVVEVTGSEEFAKRLEALITSRLTNHDSRRLHKNNVVLLLMVERLDLQRHRLTDQVGKHSEGLGFLVE